MRPASNSPQQQADPKITTFIANLYPATIKATYLCACHHCTLATKAHSRKQNPTQNFYTKPVTALFTGRQPLWVPSLFPANSSKQSQKGHFHYKPVTASIQGHVPQWVLSWHPASKSPQQQAEAKIPLLLQPCDCTFHRSPTSVGAIMAPCQPEPTTASRAKKATAVLPEPTSPCNSLTMGAGPSISLNTCRYKRVSWH